MAAYQRHCRSVDPRTELVRKVFRPRLRLRLSAAVEADCHQRKDQGCRHRNASIEQLLTTASGDIRLRIPHFRKGSIFPSLVEPRSRVDRVLCLF